MNALMIALIARSCQEIFYKTAETTTLAVRLAVILITVAVRWFTAKEASRMSYLASKSVKRIMREAIYGKLLKLGTGYREHASSAELVQESVEGVEQLETYFGQYVPQFFYAFIAPLTLFFLFALAGSRKVGAVLLICVPLIPAAIVVVQKIAKRLLTGYWAQYAQLGSAFLENLQGMTTLKTYQADAFKNEQMNAESENFRLVTMKVLTMQLNSIIIMDLIAYGGAALGIGLACSDFSKGNLTLGACIFMILLSADFFLPMRRLGSYFHVAMNGMAASDRIFRFLNEEEPEVKSGILPQRGIDIVMDDVHFAYTDDREVVSGVCLNVKEHSFVGIAGESGSGKSTIASLLMGRITPQKGTILIGGHDITGISEKSLLKTLTYVGLKSVFFKGTVRENLLPADPGADDEKLWKVLEDCGIAEYLKTEKGLETELLENAVNLSGGQKQRLALARALLHDSPVYIFDEATSNIDVESEETILACIRNLAKTKTVILITHRLANVKDADVIYCMDSGRLAGSGSHEKLLNECESYRSLWNTQKELEAFRKEALPA